MINIVKKYPWRRINELNNLIGYSDDFLPQTQNKYIVKIRLLQNNYWWLYPIFFTWKPSYGMAFSFCFEIRVHLGHLFARTPKLNKFKILFKKWAKHKVKYIYCVIQFLCDKPHKRWNQECKQKQSLLFNFLIFLIFWPLENSMVVSSL